MLKTLRTVKKQNREKFRIPRSIQQTIPVQTVWEDGIFLVGKNKYSRSWKFTDINYEAVSDEEKQSLLVSYAGILNYFDCGATTKLTVIIRRMKKEEIEESVLVPLQKDGLDKYREELNGLLLEKTVGANGMIREMYVTVTVYRKNIEEARNYFQRTGTAMAARFQEIGSVCREMGTMERLKILHDFYRPGEESRFWLNLKQYAALGHDFKDHICPDSMEFYSDYFKVGNRFGRMLYLKDYASYIEDTMTAEFADIGKDMMLSIDLIPIPTEEAVRDAQNTLLGVETNVTNWQRRQNQNNNFSAVVPYDMELQREATREFLKDLTSRDQRMMMGVVTLAHMADSKDELDADTEAVCSVAGNRLCQMAVLKFQQMDGLNTVLPIGVRKVDCLRTLTTESLCSLIPFRTREVMDEGGMYCGVNTISGNLIMVNRGMLLNPSAFILGVPGAGKSMLTKFFILQIALTSRDDQILIYDPEGEYTPLVQALGGLNLPVCAGSRVHLNAMDMTEGYGEKNPLADKSQFIMSVYERIMEGQPVGPKEKSILDRCVERVYKIREENGIIPTFATLRQILQEQDEPEAEDLALMLEIFTDGTLNIFSRPTNVERNCRIICFNTRDMGEELKRLGQLVITDYMINRVAANWEKGIRTHIFLDEFHTLLQHKFSAAFFDSAYRRFRKRNAWVTSVTQNVEYVLDSLTARTMISNSEFIIMLNQAASDREQLAELLHISPEQQKSITNAKAGHGLMRIGSALLPFRNKISRETGIYRLMTTKPEDFMGERKK